MHLAHVSSRNNFTCECIVQCMFKTQKEHATCDATIISDGIAELLPLLSNGEGGGCYPKDEALGPSGLFSCQHQRNKPVTKMNVCQ